MKTSNSDIYKPTYLTNEQKEHVDKIEALPRKERRRLGKLWGGVKIPGSNKPLTK